MRGKNTFYEITNKDIYDKLIVIDNKISRNAGMIRWHTWAIATIILLIVAIIGKLL